MTEDEMAGWHHGLDGHQSDFFALFIFSLTVKKIFSLIWLHLLVLPLFPLPEETFKTILLNPKSVLYILFLF